MIYGKHSGANVIRSVYRALICAVGVFSLCFSAVFTLADTFSGRRAEDLILRKYLMFLPPDDRKSSESPSFPELGQDSPDLTDHYSIETPGDKQDHADGTHILAADLSGDPRGGILLKNETSYELTPLTGGDYRMGNGSPKVLVLHTHATECYTANGCDIYSPDSPTRSEDPDVGVLAVGGRICDILNENGIPAVHCTVLHDRESYIRSYDNSLASIKECLEKYPDIEYVFDVHRDAIVRSDGTAVKPVSVRLGSAAAQIMLLCGTDEQGGDFDGWKENFGFACALQSSMLNLCPDSARPILVRGATYHQQYAPYSLLVEVGSFANTVDEALAGAEIFARALCSVIGITQ